MQEGLAELHSVGGVAREKASKGLRRVVGEVLRAQDADEEAVAQVVVKRRDAPSTPEPHATLGHVEAVRAGRAAHEQLERLERDLLTQPILEPRARVEPLTGRQAARREEPLGHVAKRAPIVLACPLQKVPAVGRSKHKDVLVMQRTEMLNIAPAGERRPVVGEAAKNHWTLVLVALHKLAVRKVGPDIHMLPLPDWWQLRR